MSKWQTYQCLIHNTFTACTHTLTKGYTYTRRLLFQGPYKRFHPKFANLTQTFNIIFLQNSKTKLHRLFIYLTFNHKIQSPNFIDCSTIQLSIKPFTSVPDVKLLFHDYSSHMVTSCSLKQHPTINSVKTMPGQSEWKSQNEPTLKDLTWTIHLSGFQGLKNGTLFTPNFQWQPKTA